MIPTFQLGGMGRTIRSSAASVSLRDLILADSPTMYLRLGEASGTTATNETGGTNGTHSGVVLGNAALYTGGPTSMRTDTTTDRTTWPAASVPSLTAMTIGVILRNDSSLTGVRQLVTRDNTGARYWQMTLNNANVQFVKIRGSVQTVSIAHGLSSAQVALMTVTVSAAGSVNIYRNGTNLTTASVTAVDYGGTGVGSCDIAIGNRSGTQAEAVDNRFSEAFVIPTELSAARIAQYAAAAGL